MSGTVRWAELLPQEFEERLAAQPIVYMPMGLCEPHGHVAALGLDTLKADFICDESARRFGGIVAPTQGYHIHETGYHAPFLQQRVAPANPRMSSMPPDVVMRSLLFQLRAFVNAGFRTVIVITGHNGAQRDLRLVADAFMDVVQVPVIVRSDPELVRGRYAGDHAGKFEISQLLYCRPDLVDLTRYSRAHTDPLGAFGQDKTAMDATSEYGRILIEAMIEEIGELVRSARLPDRESPFLEHSDVESVWDSLATQRAEWVSLRPEDPPE